MHTRQTNTDAESFQAGCDAKKRPDGCTDEHLTFLDDLRESGDTNMWGARPFLMDEYPDLASEQAAAILGYWMKTFGNANR